MIVVDVDNLVVEVEDGVGAERDGGDGWVEQVSIQVGHYTLA